MAIQDDLPDPYDPREDRDPQEPVDAPKRDEPWNDPDESPYEQPPEEDPDESPRVVQLRSNKRRIGLFLSTEIF